MNTNLSVRSRGAIAPLAIGVQRGVQLRWSPTHLPPLGVALKGLHRGFQFDPVNNLLCTAWHACPLTAFGPFRYSTLPKQVHISSVSIRPPLGVCLTRRSFRSSVIHPRPSAAVGLPRVDLVERVSHPYPRTLPSPCAHEVTNPAQQPRGVS